MAQIGEQRKAEEGAFMSAYWNFRKSIATPEDREEYWLSVIDGVNALEQQFNKNPYFQGILIACVADLEERFKCAEGDYAPQKDKRFIELVNFARKRNGLPELCYKAVAT